MHCISTWNISKAAQISQIWQVKQYCPCSYSCETGRILTEWNKWVNNCLSVEYLSPPVCPFSQLVSFSWCWKGTNEVLLRLNTTLFTMETCGTLLGALSLSLSLTHTLTHHLFFLSTFLHLCSVCLLLYQSVSGSAARSLAGCCCRTNRFIGCLPPVLWQPAEEESECWLRFPVPLPALSGPFVPLICLISPAGKSSWAGRMLYQYAFLNENLRYEDLRRQWPWI